MGVVLFVGFDANPALAMLGALRDKGADLAPVMAAITEVVVEQVQGGFETGTAPDGAPWKPLKSRQGQILVDTGHLSNVFRSHGEDYAEVGSAAIYAAAHQFGTRPRVLKPVNAKALFWPGARHPVKSVKHPGIPARPFIPDEQSLDWPEIDAIIRRYLEDAANAARD